MRFSRFGSSLVCRFRTYPLWFPTFVLIAVLGIAPPTGAYEPLPRSTPEDQQIDPAALAAAFDAMENLDFVMGMVVVRDGQVVGEEHWTGSASSLRDSRSVTKSVISILLGIAIEHGYIDTISDPLVDYLPPDLIPSDSAKQQITLGHLLTQTSGLQWDEDAEVVGWLNSNTPTEDILAKPMVATPGTQWNYNTAATHLLSVAIAEATGMRTLDFADATLFSALGIGERVWLKAGDYENGGAGLSLRTEDAAKLGVLFINKGIFNGHQVVSRYWVNRSTYPDVYNLGQFGALSEIHYGWLWWIDYGTDYQAYTAWGYGGQFVFCVPALKLVVAVHSPWGVSGTTADQHEIAILDIIVNQILPSVEDRRVLTTTGLDVPELVEVDFVMQDLLRNNEIQAATAALVRDGRLVFARGYTLDEPDQTPVEPTSLFRIGSIGKGITSLAVHQLIEKNLLSYDTTAQSILDLQPLPGETTDPLLEDVTVDHLLTHTSGLYSENNIYRVGELVTEATGMDDPASKEEVVSYIISHPSIFSPGTDWDYNNYGYMMLDMLVEKQTGIGFVDYLLENIFHAIGIGRARQAHQLQIELAPTEVSYDGLEGDPYRSIVDVGAGPGGLVMSAPDMARLFSVLFDQPDAGGLVSADTRASMLELPFPVTEALGYGRGWYNESFFEQIGVSVGDLVDPDDGLEVYAHGGGGSGVHTFALWRGDNTVFVMFNNQDPVVEELDFPAIEVWPDHDLWDTVGIQMEPVGPAATESWIPVVSHADGVGSSTWRSDVGLLNRSTLPNSVRLRQYQAGQYSDIDLILATNEQRAIGDVVGQFGLEGSGPLRVFSSEPLTVTSRTYNQGDQGTYGQFLPGKAHIKGMGSGESVVLMQLKENNSARTNIGLTNGWRRKARVEITLFDGSGNVVAEISRTVPPEQTMQLNRPFFNQGGRSDIDSGYAVISIESAENLFAYASVIDNGSGDPTTIPSKRAPGFSSQWVSAAAHANGANESQWRTDVAVLNPSDSEASVDLRFHGSNGQVISRSLTVSAGHQTALDDVVAWLGQEGSGAIECVSDIPILVTSRTYNLSDDESFGQFLDGESVNFAADVGEKRWLPQLIQNSAFRTNIGVLNTSSGASKVRVRLYDNSGTELAVANPTLNPGQRLQMQEPFDRLAHRNDIDAGYVTVEVRQGEGVFCYASVIDNLTNDPTTIPAQQ